MWSSIFWDQQSLCQICFNVKIISSVNLHIVIIVPTFS